MNKQPIAPIPLDVRMVARIGLSVAGAAAIGLWAVLASIGGGTASGYGQVIAAVGLARENLGPALLVFGLAMVGFAGLSAWLFSLYAGFRIAGPLYGISRDLEILIDNRGPVVPMPIRVDDQLQTQWKEFAASVDALQGQRSQLQLAVSAVEKALHDNDEGFNRAALAHALTELKNVVQRVHF
jgi:hypothetical protein